MHELIWNPKWQLSPPKTIELKNDGSITFKGPIGDVYLPEDYLNFIRESDGAALRDKDSFFEATFDDGASIFEIEWLGKLNTVMFQTWDFYEHSDPQTHKLPRHYISIGYAEPNASRVVLCADRASADYGKISVWVPANDVWMVGDNTRGLGYVAESFNQFMNSLRTSVGINRLHQ